MKNIGYFDKLKKEYVITDMRPRRPFENYLWNEEFLLNINNFGFGESFLRISSQMRRQLFTTFEATRLVYIKDKDSGEFYDINRNYSNKPFTKYECHVGIGYHKIVSEYNGVLTEYNITVPKKGNAELWQITVKNTSDNEKNLSVISYSRPDANVTTHLAYGHADFEESLNGLYFCHDAFAVDHDYSGIFVKSDIKPDSFDLSDVNFKGIYNGWDKPVALENDRLTCLGASFDDKYCAALQFNISLTAGEEKIINIAVGLATSLENAIALSDEYLLPDSFENAVRVVKEDADKMDSVYIANTPDDYINQMVNTWLKRQISLGKTWGRVYGKGFRDIMQDTAGLVSFDIEMAKAKIILCLEHQRYNGNPIRMFDPIMEEPYYDGAAWIPATLLAYIKESGDASILDVKCRYIDNDTEETVFEHMHKGLRFLLDNRGARNMVLWGGGDWNDSINNTGYQLKGESAWLSIATVKAITEFCEILEYIGGYDDLIKSITNERDILKNAIVENAFEDDQFIYGINDWDEKVGSKENREGQTYLNTQTWAVLADILDRDGCEKIMQTVEDKLKCDFGYVQCYPAYSIKDEHIGRMAYFIPGGFENGSVYNHGVAFKIAADCKLGKNDTAFKTLKMISYDNPANADSGVEPYVVSNMYLGPQDKNRPGYAPYSWITGTAGWLYRDITEYILGITSEFTGLKIDPCLPSHWDNVEIKRIYRGATYNITLRRTGNKKLIVDGKEVGGNIAPIFPYGTAHNVICEF